MNRLLAICGPSGSGKTLAAGRLADMRGDVLRVVTATTRPPRPGERNGYDYWFLAPETFERALSEGGLLAATRYMDHRYGVPADTLLESQRMNRHAVVVVDAEGARLLAEAFPGRITIALLAPPAEMLHRRLYARDGASPATDRRSEAASAEITAVEQLGCHRIDAEDLTFAVRQLSQLLPVRTAVGGPVGG